MYSLDHEDVALGPYASSIAPAWCEGTVVSAPDAVNDRFITNSPTYTYLSTREAFRCPADVAGLMHAGKVVLRNRSYAMNAFMGDTTTSWVQNHRTVYKTVPKTTAITGPGPSAIYILVDEHENSINDSHFFPFNDLRTFNNNPWLDAPSGRHGDAAGFTFADGHSEVKKWRSSGLSVFRRRGREVMANDITWLPRAVQADHQWFTNSIAPTVK
jgi:prepilin-type processing-associated H-X9-DG protein